MWPWSIPFWLGAVALAGWGGVLILSGLRRRFISTNDTQDTKSRRRIWLVCAGLFVWVIAFGFASRPSARQNGYLGYLPVSVQVDVWPAWRLRWWGLGSDTRTDWDNFLIEVETLRFRDDGKELTETMYHQCLAILHQDSTKRWYAEDAADLLGRLRFGMFAENELSFITTEDIRFLMANPNVEAAKAGVMLANRLSPRSPELIRDIFEWKRYDYHPRIDTVLLAYEADIKHGRQFFDQVFGGEDLRAIQNAIGTIEPRILHNEDDYEYLLLWLKTGPPETRLAILRALCNGRLRGYTADRMSHLSRDDVRNQKVESLVAAMLDVVEDVNDEPRSFGSLTQIRQPSWYIVPMVTERLDATDDPAAAGVFIRILRAQGAQAVGAIPTLERFAENPAWSPELRKRATDAAAWIRNPVTRGVGCRSG